ncbi:hypothetical protein [Pseudobacteriovorax antillogorgiicola]|uniref:Uncharacterized protein n=1 Tax=Pseudobacteriovorax antillogorgiicola TaxID=1513793 RepID=A0A1Y6B3G6_9BACT|nr:hypothetical protein [Pseudobacteriovorax antillogorgiicola]TCS59313.1 hypothetical protein EDD56_101220 [Pseudobacteriovorax antillogorgiicola]SME89495.1 hypothetical protein SAMN06296036_101266 [Pseudobacteriovorax antillogorgiicola]
MSYIPPDSLQGRNLIAQFVLSLRKSGFVLPYREYQYIDQWLKLGHEDEVLLVLDEVLPPLFKKAENHRHPPSLRFVHREVCQKMRGLKQRAQSRKEWENEVSET